MWSWVVSFFLYDIIIRHYICQRTSVHCTYVLVKLASIPLLNFIIPCANFFFTPSSSVYQFLHQTPIRMLSVSGNISCLIFSVCVRDFHVLRVSILFPTVSLRVSFRPQMLSADCATWCSCTRLTLNWERESAYGFRRADVIFLATIRRSFD